MQLQCPSVRSNCSGYYVTVKLTERGKSNDIAHGSIIQVSTAFCAVGIAVFFLGYPVCSLLYRMRSGFLTI